MGMAPSPPAAQRLVTKQQYDQVIAGFNSNFKAGPFEGQDYQSTLQKFKDTMSVLPPPAPDLTDETVQRARQAARRRLLMGGLTGPIDLSGASVAKPPPGLTGV
jgi:hypothetical protein